MEALQRRMREIVERDLMQVGPLGFTKEGGRRTFAVKSRSKANVYQQVVHQRNGNLRCSCEYQQYHETCPHIETVLLYLESLPVLEAARVLYERIEENLERPEPILVVEEKTYNVAEVKIDLEGALPSWFLK